MDLILFFSIEYNYPLIYVLNFIDFFIFFKLSILYEGVIIVIFTVDTYVCMFIRIHVCIHTYVCMYIHTYVCIHVCMYTCMYVIRMYICVFVCLSICKHMQARIWARF
jgi:hypothetical protein